MTGDSRYDDILRRIRQRQQDEAHAPQQQALGSVLDDLNALGCLEDLQRRHHRQVVCYGPGTFRGFAPQVWVGAVLWYRRRGYYDYHTLRLLGIWALSGDPALVILGGKTLTFSAPAFNPESYHFHIRRGFDVYYRGDASPPPEHDQRLAVAYDPARRLDIRRQLEAALAEWEAEPD